MTYGPLNGATDEQQGQIPEPFNFGQEMFGAGLTTMALVWTAPWRAASVIVSEALRENLDRMR